MKLRINIALTVGCWLISAFGLLAQAAPPAQQQKAPAQQPAQKPTESNPFPEDTTSVPVVPTAAEPTAAAPTANVPENSSAESTSLLKNDGDPVHSPDDPADTGPTGADGFSSSLAGSGDVNIPDEDRPDKHRRGQQPVAHQVTAKENEDVANFELGRKNYKAALSRFESALVTDSENPDVYWGIAEAQRGLGNFSDAKANYQKVVDYDDPESKHAKEAKKLLKSQQLANAPAVSANQPK